MLPSEQTDQKHVEHGHVCNYRLHVLFYDKEEGSRFSAAPLMSCTAQGFPASFERSSEAAPDSRCAERKLGFKHVMTCPEHTAFLRVELECKPR